MSFDIESVSKKMISAMSDAVKDDVGEIRQYADTIIENEKKSLKKLGEARIQGQIDDDVFDREIRREKKVVETELLAIQLMTEASAQKAVNSAMSVFVKAVKAAF